eukprot:scaffold273081_cov26-Tisochrysis_lutea.AAC.2
MGMIEPVTTTACVWHGGTRKSGGDQTCVGASPPQPDEGLHRERMLAPSARCLREARRRKKKHDHTRGVPGNSTAPASHSQVRGNGGSKANASDVEETGSRRRACLCMLAIQQRHTCT